MNEESMSALFRPLDLMVILLYLAAMIALGVFFARRNKTTEDYFLGNRSFPGWVIGISLLGTSISSITFLALPAGAFALDWRMLVPNLMLPIIAVMAIFVFIPLFRKGRAVSAFEYLEQRYSPIARLYGAISFMILQLMRIGLVLFLVSLPLQVLTGISPVTLIIFGGIFIVVYTLLGGIEGVIWTDVAQTLILLGGGIICFTLIILELPGGLTEIFRVGGEYEKFSIGEFRWDWGERTFYTMVITGLFGWIGMYTSDQNVIQRYLAAASTREAQKAVGLAAIMAVPTWAFFFFIGTCLFVYFQTFPDPAIEGMDADQVFPYFILSTVPVGISGLIIAGILAAAMSTLDSSLNSLSTVFVNDILRRHVMKGRSDRFYLRSARTFVFLAGTFMILFALLLTVTDRESIMDVNLILAAIFGGALSGMYLVGFFTERVGARQMLIGLVAAIAVNVYLVLLQWGYLPEAIRLNIHAYWAGILVNGVFAIVALACSLFGRKRNDLDGLTVWTIGLAANDDDGIQPTVKTTEK